MIEYGVMTVLPGRSSRRIYVSGPYDSLNLGEQGQTGPNTGAATNPQATPEFNHDAVAPGANDDASGTVLTMELARVFAESGLEFDATLVFICWAGEEQGAIGSAVHAQNLVGAHATVALKFLPEDLSHDAATVERFRREARTGPDTRKRSGPLS